MKLAYWKKYNAVLKKFGPLAIHSLVLSFAKKLGDPYRTAVKGRKPKLMPAEYAAYIVYKIITKNATFREMEFESKIYTNTHLDHSTLVVNFEKIPPEYFLNLIEETGACLDKLLEFSDQYAIDSTAVTTPLKFETIIKGKIVEEKIEFRSHIIASLHLADKTVCIRKALSTTKKIADCEGAKRMIEEGKIKNITLHADRGYDYERVYKACYEHNIKANIRPQDYLLNENSQRQEGVLQYDDDARKKYRGIIETVFGGLTNAGLLVTRLKKEIKIISFGAIVLLRHNIMNIARNTNY